MTKTTPSQRSIADASRSRAKFSSQGTGLGAAGTHHHSSNSKNAHTLRKPGQSVAISPSDTHWGAITIGATWSALTKKRTDLIGRLLGLSRTHYIDLDLGCLYELQDGTRGALQAFGEKWGSLNTAPFIALSEDERTGRADGFDEHMTIADAHWSDIKRIVVYLYNYNDAATWSQITPEVFIDIPGEEDLAVTLTAPQDHLDLCAIGMLDNIRNGLKLTNISEYFHGHEDMDRAFGFGLPWGEGEKQP